MTDQDEEQDLVWICAVPWPADLSVLAAIENAVGGRYARLQVQDSLEVDDCVEVVGILRREDWRPVRPVGGLLTDEERERARRISHGEPAEIVTPPGPLYETTADAGRIMKGAAEAGRRTSEPVACGEDGCDFSTDWAPAMVTHKRHRHPTPAQEAEPETPQEKGRLAEPVECGWPDCDFKTDWPAGMARHRRAKDHHEGNPFEDDAEPPAEVEPSSILENVKESARQTIEKATDAARSASADLSCNHPDCEGAAPFGTILERNRHRREAHGSRSNFGR